jgi:SAM-dependent methyltransferase
MPVILPHNQRAGLTWGAGGKDYEAISENVADGIAHVVNRVWPVPDERFLDVATGTGWTARSLAARGAAVTAIDIGEGVIEAAKRLGPGINFQVGDAEALAFEDTSFDGITSTYGVMFVARPEVAAAEIARVTRKGGRLGLVTWVPNGAVEDIFGMMRSYIPAPPTEPPPSPFEWGREERVRELLGDAFDLTFERGTTVLRMPSGEVVWDIYFTGFGPTKTLAGLLDAERGAALRRDFIAIHEKYRTPAGIAMPREYLVTIGMRR